MRTPALVLVLSISTALAGCASTSATGGGRVAEAERLRAQLAAKDPSALAPHVFAQGDQELRLARDAQSRGDTMAADLHAERASATFNRAIALARLARANEDEASARDGLARATEQGERYAAARKAAEREAEDVEKQLRIARERELPAASRPADADRERARLLAAQALVAQARLLCSAARLVSAQAPGLGEAEAAAAELDLKLQAGQAPSASGKSPAPIDAAARTRVACLTALTKARRGSTTDVDQADALLTELSQSQSTSSAANAASPPRGPSFTPSRDERGVVVTLRNVFNGDHLTPEGAASLKDLGRVAAAHPGFGLQVVVHDADASATGSSQKRSEAVVAALKDGGAPSDRIRAELTGVRAPVVDPRDGSRRERNARVEIVFVAPGSPEGPKPRT